MKVTVSVTRRADIADPQGATVARALRDLGYSEVETVRVDKAITLEVAGDDPAAIEGQVKAMCERLLANPVMEDFDIQVHA